MEEGKVPKSVKSFMVFSGVVFALIFWQIIPSDAERSELETFFASMIIGGGLWFYIALPYLRFMYGVRFCDLLVKLATFLISFSFFDELLSDKLKLAGTGGLIVLLLVSFIATIIYSYWLCGGTSEEDE